MLVIVGSSGGLGSSLVKKFRDSKQFSGELVEVTRSQMDLGSSRSVEDFFSSLVKRVEPGERIQLVNAAGVSINGMAHKLSDESWSQVLDTNLTGTFRLLRAFYNLARQHPGSSATVFSSVVAQMGVPGTAAYAASKSGLTGLVRTLSQEWGRSGLRVNGIHLGYFDKGMIQQVSREQQEALVQRVPLGRLGNEDDLHEACLFCFQCQYLTGSMIHLNGGLL